MTKRSVPAAIAAALLATTFAATGASAAGFRLPEAGAKAMGMAFAFTAQANDPSAIYFNPAGLTQLSGANLMAGATYIRENGQDFTGSTRLTRGETRSETQKDLNFVAPNGYAAYRGQGSSLAYGIGVFVPFGLGQEYQDRDRSIFRDLTTKIDLQTVVVNPTVAWKINEGLSVGGGVDFLYGKAKLSKNAVSPLDNATNLFRLDMEAEDTAWGYNIGLLLKPSDALQAGFSYRSGFDLKLKDGDIDITQVAAPLQGAPPLGFGGATYRSGGSTRLKLPATAALGIAVKPVERLTLEADLDWTFWSSYRSLDITVEQPRSYLQSSSTQKRWKDVAALRVGAEYRATPSLALRAGYAYDPTPVPADTLSAELPDADRNNYTAGIGYKIGAVTVDASYFYLQKKDRTISQSRTAADSPKINGKWEGDAHLVALDLGLKF
jgi:long-chain fatty acid transport protein